MSNNNWISVKDRWPKIGETVLVYENHYDSIVTSELRDYGTNGIRFCDYTHNSLYPFYDPVDAPWLPDVTHWQPLPSPPDKRN